MKKSIFIMLMVFLLMPSSMAWDWQTHPRIIQKVIEALPIEIQENLNMSQIIKGSIAPDRDFHDNVVHHYPPSYNKTLEWLNKTEVAWEEKNYNEASYNFGVASHYITDSFATPHYIYKEPGWLHSRYEKQPNQFEIQTTCTNKQSNIDIILKHESTKAYLWSSWLKNYSPEIPQQQVELATELMYSVALETFNTKCATTTEMTEDKNYSNLIPKKSLLIIIAISLVSLISIKKLKFFKN